MEPDTEIVSDAVILMAPALPGPTTASPVKRSIPLRLLILAPSFTTREPTVAVSAPAFPSQPVDISIRVPAFSVKSGVAMLTVPALPGVRAGIGVKPILFR
jgi:hypothetical protein